MPGLGSHHVWMLPGEERSSQSFPLAPPTEQASRVDLILGEARELYMRKAAGYKSTADFLGAKGQFADMNRKFWRIYSMLWTEEVPPDDGEGVEEILMDLMGHCALTIDFLRRETK